MANLTYRSVKGSPLTNDELDGNFEYFTGSHAITGSLTISDSLDVVGSMTVNSLGVTHSIEADSISADSIGAASIGANSIGANSIGADSISTSTITSSLFTFKPIDSLPDSEDGTIAFSSSGDFYFRSGSTWNKLTL